MSRVSRFNLYDILLLSLMIGSSFYTTFLGLSPVYVIVPLTLMVGGIYSLKNNEKVYIDISVFIFIFCLPFIFINIYYANSVFAYPIILNFILAVLVYIYILSLSSGSNISSRARIATFYTIFVIVIVIVDTFFRFKYPVYNIEYLKDGSDSWFYQYKSSYIFGDSNVVSLLLLNVIFFRIAFSKLLNEKNNKFILLVLILLLAATISRSAWVSCILGFAYILISRYRITYLYIGFCLLLIGAFYLGDIYEFIFSDRSGSTKLNEIGGVIKFYSSYDLSDIILGLGFGNGQEVTGRYIHGLFSKLLVEGGGGLFLLIFSFYIYIYIKHEHIRPYIFVLILSSFSLSFYITAPFQLASIAFLISSKRVLRTYEQF